MCIVPSSSARALFKKQPLGSARFAKFVRRPNGPTRAKIQKIIKKLVKNWKNRLLKTGSLPVAHPPPAPIEHEF